MTDYTVGDTLHIAFSTRAFATGIPTVLAGTPVVSAYEDASLTQITAGITLGVDHDSVVGLNMLTIVATGANGYGSGQDYNLVITTGTVGGVSVVGEVVGRFTLGRSASAVDLANGTDGLGAIKTDTDAILVDTGTTLDARIPAALVGGRMDSTIDATGFEDAAVDKIWDEDATGHQTTGTFGQAIGDPGANIETMYDAVVTDAAGTNVSADIAAVKTDTAAILTDTAEIGVAGAGLTNIDLPNQTMDITGSLSGSVGSVTGAVGSVTSAVTIDSGSVDAIWDEDIVAAHGTADTAGLTLSELTKRAITFSTAVLDGSALGQIADDGTAVFDRTTDSLQAISDSGGGGPTAAVIADAVWDEVKADHTGTTTFGDLATDLDSVLADTADIQPKMGTPAADVSADIAAVKSDSAAILIDTTGLNGDAMRGTDGANTTTPLTAAQVNAEVVDVINTDTSGEPAQGAPTATASLRTKIDWLYKVFRNRKRQTAAVWELMNDAETVVDSKATVSDDGTTAIKQEVVSGP